MTRWNSGNSDSVHVVLSSLASHFFINSSSCRVKPNQPRHASIIALTG